MNRNAAITLAASLAVAGMTYVSPVAIGQNADNAAERAGQNVERAAENAGQATENAAQDAAQESRQGLRQAEQRAQQSADQMRLTESGQQPQLPAGVRAAEQSDDAKDGITDTFTGLTEAAVTEGGFNDLLERLADQDRNRMGEQEVDDAGHQQLVQRFREAWEQKYGEEFEIEDDVAFQNVTVMSGEVQNPEQVAANWPLRASAQQPQQGMTGDTAVPAAAREDAERIEDGNIVGEDPIEAQNLEEGREVAIAHLPAEGELPALTVSLIGELQGWVVDIPNSVTRQQINDNLTERLTQLTQDANALPADKNEATTLVTRHVLAALYDLPADGAQQQMQQPGMERQPGMQQQPGMRPQQDRQQQQ